jgi:hypothetical protein
MEIQVRPRFAARLAVAVLLLAWSSVPAFAQATRVGPTFAVGSNAARFVDVAFDPVNNVYFVVWGAFGKPHGRFVAPDGTVLGAGSFQIPEGSTPWSDTPRVAYSPDAQAFMVVWSDVRFDGAGDVLGRMVRFGVGGTATFLTGDLLIVDAGGVRSGVAAAIAYSTGSDEFLVAWHNSPSETWAQRVNNAGQPIGAQIPLGVGGNWNDHPAVGYNAHNDTFYVAWVSFPHNQPGTVLARTVKAGTGAVAALPNLEPGGTVLALPDVAYDASTGRMLCAWFTNSGPGDAIMARWINLDGSVSSRFPLLNGYVTFDAFSIARSAVTGTYFAVFYVNSYENAGREIAADGTPGPIFLVTQTGSSLGNFNPRVGAGGGIDEWLVATSFEYKNARAQRIKSGGASTAPAVSSVLPGSGPTEGGTAVTITGANFAAGASVTIGGIAASGIAVVNPNTITAFTPARPTPGPVNVVVTNPNNESGTLANGFTYVGATGPAPTVSGVDPASGPTTGGTAVTITGTNFVSGATVSIGGVPASAVQVLSDTSITAVTGPHAAGTVTAVVQNPDGQSAAKTNAFTYVAPPVLTVTGISPNSGPNTGGTVIYVSGTGFLPGAVVTLGDTPATTIGVAPDMIAAVTAARFAAGLVQVRVTNPGGPSVALAGSGFTYNAVSPTSVPAITTIIPNTGPITGGNTLIIAGRNFVNGARVRVGKRKASAITVVSANVITAVVPEGLAPGAYKVRVATNGHAAVMHGAYTYTAVPTTPIVTAISPGSGPTTGGTQVTISGSGFNVGASVKIGDVNALVIHVTWNTIVAVTGPRLAFGLVPVVVVNPGGLTGQLPNGGFFYTLGS